MRRKMLLWLCGVIGIMFVIQYFIPHKISQDLFSRSNDWLRIIAVFAFVLGFSSVIRIHGKRISRRSEDWKYSIFVFIGLAIMPLMALVDSISAKEFIVDGPRFEWFFFSFQVPLGATMFSLLAFYIASAAYRSFRARTFEATLLLLAGVALMVANAPFGNIVWDATIGKLAGMPKGFPTILGDWLLKVPNMAARRAIMIGLALGAISQSIRIIFGIDRAWMGE